MIIRVYFEGLFYVVIKTTPGDSALVQFRHSIYWQIEIVYCIYGQCFEFDLY